jgi:hypothetical protein
VRADGRQCAARIRRGHAEFAVALALEKQHPVREHRGAADPLLEARGKRAEVLADHDAAAAPALGCEDRKHALDVVAHVGAVARAGAARDAIQARDAHNVVDSRDSRVAHRRTQRPGKQVRARAALRRRQSPVLAFQVVRVRGRADARIERVAILVRPCLGAAAID